MSLWRPWTGLATAVALGGCVSMGASGRSGGGSVAVGSAAEEARVDTLDRTVPPLVGPPPSMDLPDPSPIELSNGLRVWLVGRRDVPLVSVDLQLRGGASREDDGRAGLAALTADMIDEGTSSRSALELADEIDRLGASLSSFAGRDANRLRLTALSTKLVPAMELLAEVVLDARFEEPELERVREEQRTRILQGRDEPRVLADEALARALFGPGHPYGRPVLGTPATVSALTRDDVVAYYEANYRADNAVLVVTGDVSEDSLVQLLERTLGAWSGGGAARTAPPAHEPLGETTVYIVDRPDAAQSEIRVGRVATSRATPDFYTLTVLNTVLGGSFTSRLNANLREDKGFTYGARSSFALRRHAGPFVAGAAVHTPATAAAVSEILTEMRRLVAEPVPADELARARNFVALRLPQGFETVSDLASRLAELVLYDLPADYFDDYVERVLAVTAEDVQDAARRYLTGQLAIVVAGDRAAIEQPLRALGVGSVVIVEPQEEPSAEGEP